MIAWLKSLLQRVGSFSVKVPIPAEKPLDLSDASKIHSVGAKGIELVRHFEGLYLTAYRCPADVWTIGYGHTGMKHNDGSVYKGRKITEEVAIELLKYDLGKFSEGVAKLVKVPVNQEQFDALVSFHFNTGALGKSTLLKALNRGDFEMAANEFGKWNKGGGKVLAGLTRRRRAEHRLFTDGVLDFSQVG